VRNGAGMWESHQQHDTHPLHLCEAVNQSNPAK
jgi:hypothetical protein